MKCPTTAATLASDELLRNGRGLGRIRFVVFRDEFELDLLAADADALRIRVLDRELHAVLDVDADVRLRARQRRGDADLHYRHGVGRIGLCRVGLGGGCLLFLAATGGGNAKRETESGGEASNDNHLISNRVGNKRWANAASRDFSLRFLHVSI